MTIQMTDRELIDAAVAAGMVRKIPRGVSGIDPDRGYGWKEIGIAILANNRRAQRLSRPEKPQLQKITRADTSEGLNAQIRKMRLDGLTFDQIGWCLDMAKSAIWRRCKALGLEGNRGDLQ